MTKAAARLTAGHGFQRTTSARAGLISLLLVSVSPLLAGTQPPPNFTGTWKQNNQLTTPAGTTDRIYTETIDHAGTILKVRIRAISGPGMLMDDRLYTIDGRPHSSPTGSGERTATARWDGATLVVETVDQAKTGDVTRTRRETWVLSQDGRTLTKTIQIRDGAGENDVRMILEKQ